MSVTAAGAMIVEDAFDGLPQQQDMASSHP
jgi:hypothetical protein